MPPQTRNFPFLPALSLLGPFLLLMTSGMTFWGIGALLLAVIWFAIEFARWLMPPKERPARPLPSSQAMGVDSEDPLISLVFFLDEARATDEAGIRQCVSSALGTHFDVHAPDSDVFVIPFSPPDDGEIKHFMVRIPEGLFAVLVSDQPYIDDPKSFAKGAIRDKRLRTAVEKHVAWISVDLMDDTRDPGKTREAYLVIGKILAAMAGPDCLAIYCPELQRCNEFDPGLLEDLAGPDPIHLFNEPTFEPVIEISDNNPRMAAAVKEAISRWPEFVAAYEKSTSSERERFIAKAEFSERKRSEYMWVTVRTIEDGEVSGILMNDPHELMDVHRGAIVTFPLSRLNDWIYPGADGSHIGGFTLDVLAESEED
jgi:uncharacterized protein YegJ (DUF2314 family)